MYPPSIALQYAFDLCISRAYRHGGIIGLLPGSAVCKREFENRIALEPEQEMIIGKWNLLKVHEPSPCSPEGRWEILGPKMLRNGAERISLAVLADLQPTLYRQQLEEIRGMMGSSSMLLVVFPTRFYQALSRSPRVDSLENAANRAEVENALRKGGFSVDGAYAVYTLSSALWDALASLMSVLRRPDLADRLALHSRKSCCITSLGSLPSKLCVTISGVSENA